MNKTQQYKPVGILTIAIMATLVTVSTLFITITIKSNVKIDEEIKGCYDDCSGVEPLDYEAILAEERVEYQLANKVAVEERKQEEARIAETKRKEELEVERIKRQEEKAKEKQIVSRGSGYQSSYEITFYTAFCPTGCTGTTASGYSVSNTIYYEGLRIVAAPPNIKLYTKLRITFEDGSKIDAIALDRGGDIQGARLDLLVSNRDEAYRLGRQQVKVEIIR